MMWLCFTFLAFAFGENELRAPSRCLGIRAHRVRPLSLYFFSTTPNRLPKSVIFRVPGDRFSEIDHGLSLNNRLDLGFRAVRVNEVDEHKSQPPTTGVSAALLGTGLLWLIQVLIAYSSRRFHLIKTLKVDIAHRAGSAANAYFLLVNWRNSFTLYPDTRTGKVVIPNEIQRLEIRAEEHVVYRNIQSQLVACLWGDEIGRVRAIYRWLDLIEKRVDRIQATYLKVCDTMVKKSVDATSPDRQIGEIMCELDADILRYREYLETLFTPAEVQKIGEDARAWKRLLRTGQESEKLAQGTIYIRQSPPLPFPLRKIAQDKVGDTAENRRSDESMANLRERANDHFIPIVSAYGTLLFGPIAIIAWYGTFLAVHAFNLSHHTLRGSGIALVVAFLGLVLYMGAQMRLLRKADQVINLVLLGASFIYLCTSRNKEIENAWPLVGLIMIFTECCTFLRINTSLVLSNAVEEILSMKF
jgi:hypothetical protein